MVMRVHPRRIRDAIGGVDYRLTRQGRQLADGADNAVNHADVRRGMTGRRAGQAGHDGVDVAEPVGISNESWEVSMNSEMLELSEMQAAAGQACRLMKVLANADRLMILCQLSLGEKRVGELEELLGIVQPTLSQQLTVLRDEELVSTRREGKAIYYQLSSPQALA
eukprot:gene16924-22961_t